MTNTNRIEITEQHKKLLKAMSRYLTLDDEYWSVPQFDAKRPYGNRYYEADVIKIIGEFVENNTYKVFNEVVDLDEEIPVHIYEKVIELQRELTQVLKQILGNL